MRVTINKNLPNSAEPQALSRYRPPYKMVATANARVIIFGSARVDVMYTHGKKIDF
jgi:hypothetical protein